MGFTPAVSVEAACSFRKKFRVIIRKAGTTDITELTQMLNPVVHGWMNYFCAFTPSEVFLKGNKLCESEACQMDIERKQDTVIAGHRNC